MTDTDTIIIPEDPIPEDEMSAVAKTKKKKTAATKKKKTTTTTKKRTTSKKYSKTGIPGLSVRFNWKEFLGINKLRRKFTKKTGIPTTQAGIERKIGKKLTDWLTDLFFKKKEE